MSPLNRGPLLGPRMPPAGIRPPLPRFGIGRLHPMPGMPQRMPPPPPMGPMFGPMRQRMMPPRPGPPMMRPGGGPPLPPPPPPLPLFGPRGRGVPPLMPPMMGPRGLGPRGGGGGGGGGGSLMRPGPRGLLPPQGLPRMRPRFPMGNGNIKLKQAINSAKKASKLEELELKKPWMTDEIRNEIQKKNKLYAKAKKNKDAKEWDEFKDLRNKVTRMIRDAKNEYLAKNPEQAYVYQDDKDEPYDQRDEKNCVSSDGDDNDDDDDDDVDDTNHYCEVCDREFNNAELLERHIGTHKTCGIDGCTFYAHPKLVEKHISMQHTTGLYHRMKNLSTPEDIKKWIAERKKKYPTKINAEQKNAAQIEKRERGEIIEKRAEYHGTKKPIRSDKKRKLRKRKPREYQETPKTLIQLYQGLRPFAGTANLPKYISEDEKQQEQQIEKIVEKPEIVESPTDACVISDDEDDANQLQQQCGGTLISKLPEVEPTIKNQSGLASLMANYGSDSEEDEGPDQVPIQRIENDLQIENNSPPSSTTMEVELVGDSQKTIIQRAPKVPTKIRKTMRLVKNDEKSNDKIPRNTTNMRNVNQKRLMLLQRLLSRSIQHERNLICQCVKYIADNNYFI